MKFPFDYRKFDQLTIADLELLLQVYYRLNVEGYAPGFSFGDFLDIVVGRGEHEFNEFREMDLIQTLNEWLLPKAPRKIGVKYA